MTTEPSDGQNIPPELPAGVRKYLSRHGHAYQYAVLRELDRLATNGRSRWVFEVAEFPVQAGDSNVHIDFVLRDRACHRYMIAECKRASPKLANWCFTSVPYVTRNESRGRVIVDQLFKESDERVVSDVTTLGFAPDILFELGFELRTGKEGDFSGQHRQAIESAATQAVRGVNGFMQALAAWPEPLVVNAPTALIPVVFTTASLFVANAALADADLESGNLPQTDLKLEARPWLWYRYHASPTVRHSLLRKSTPKTLPEILDKEYARAVAVVSMAGLGDFMSRDW